MNSHRLIESPGVFTGRNDRSIRPTCEPIDPARGVSFKVERTGNHGEANRYIGKPRSNAANDHGMEQVRLNNVELFPLQETNKANDLAGKPKQIRIGGEIKIARVHGDAGGSKAIDKISLVAIKNS